LVAAIPFLLAFCAIVLHTSLGRPIWIDEFTHFAFAAEPTIRDAWDLFTATATNVLHGQTGVYVMLNYWTLTNLGLDTTLLRLPSIMSGVLLMVSSIVFLRVLNFSVLWQIVMVAALLGQDASLMYFVGEARPYMPLAAASVGILAYYVARPVLPESRPVMALGIISAVTGALMHPYFAVYWPAVCLVAYVHNRVSTRKSFSLRSLIAFANPALVVLGAGLYLLIAGPTWLRGRPAFSFDPFEWMREPFMAFTKFGHTQFLDGSYGLAVAFTCVVVLGLVLLPQESRQEARFLLAPFLLIVVAIALSMLVAWISYMSNYWIVGRQWIASVALVALGTVWLWAEAGRIWARVSPVLGLAALGIAALIVSGQALNVHHLVRIAQLRSVLADPRPQFVGGECLPLANLNLAAMSNDEANRVMVELANRNIACGGPVWPVFREYYRQGRAS
jgi:hypothetical protein